MLLGDARHLQQLEQAARGYGFAADQTGKAASAR
jgi:hypothetical protein